MPNAVPTAKPPGWTARPQRHYETSDPRLEDKRFYASAAWRKLRASILASHPLCSDCRKGGRTTLAVHVHHVVERKADPSKSLDRSNLEALCVPCHNAKRKQP